MSKANLYLKQQLENRLQNLAKQKRKDNFYLLVFSLIPISTLVFATFLAFQVTRYRPDAEKIAEASRYNVPAKILGSAENLSQSSSSVSNSEGKFFETFKNADLSQLPSESILDIPLIEQIYSLSCEVASLQMALAHYNVEQSQDTLLERVGYSQPLELTKIDDRWLWGNPDKGFVGHVKGWFTGEQNGERKLEYGTGWGVNNGRIAEVAQEFLKDSVEIDGAKIEHLKFALSQGHPVIFWHARDDAFQGELEYFSPDGEKFKFIHHHVNLLVGYSTNEEGNTTYYFNDPDFGRLELSEVDMIRWWQRYNNDVVIVL